MTSASCSAPPDRRAAGAAPPRIRVSDADREATVQELQRALGRGLLSFEEAGERMTAAYASRFAAELADLTADLPPATTPDTPDTSGRARPWAAPPARHSVGPEPGVRPSGRRILLALLAVLVFTVVVLGGLLLLALGGIALHDLLYLGHGPAAGVHGP